MLEPHMFSLTARVSFLLMLGPFRREIIMLFFMSWTIRIIEMESSKRIIHIDRSILTTLTLPLV